MLSGMATPIRAKRANAVASCVRLPIASIAFSSRATGLAPSDSSRPSSMKLANRSPILRESWSFASLAAASIRPRSLSCVSSCILSSTPIDDLSDGNSVCFSQAPLTWTKRSSCARTVGSNADRSMPETEEAVPMVCADAAWSSAPRSASAVMEDAIFIGGVLLAAGKPHVGIDAEAQALDERSSADCDSSQPPGQVQRTLRQAVETWGQTTMPLPREVCNRVRRSDLLVQRQCQEFGELVLGAHLREDRCSPVELAGEAVGLDLRQLLGHQLPDEIARDLAAVVEHALRAADPLPDLRAADLGRRRVFHEVVDRHAAVAREPCAEVVDAHADVHAQARFGDRRLGPEVEQVGGLDRDLGLLLVELVGPCLLYTSPSPRDRTR